MTYVSINQPDTDVYVADRSSQVRASLLLQNILIEMGVFQIINRYASGYSQPTAGVGLHQSPDVRMDLMLCP